MAVYSMTGFASGQSEVAPPTATPGTTSAGTARLGLEIRSVNSRFLDLAFRLPEELRSHEPALRDRLATRLKRGKVELRLTLEQASDASLPDPSPRLLQRLNALQDGVRAWLPQAQALSVADVLRLSSAQTAPSTLDATAVLALADEVLTQLLAARAREGQRLTTMLQGHVAALHVLATQAAPLVPQLVAQQRSRFLERWKEAMGLTSDAPPSEAAQDRALSEATAFAIRIDVAEELTRLGAHLEEIDRLLGKGGEIGKRLDFLIQELHREANTLGSKSAVLEMTRISVDMKVLIEQMREQVQNLE